MSTEGVTPTNGERLRSDEEANSPSARREEDRTGDCLRAWYVAKTKPRQEIQTSTVLQQRGLETYFPMITPKRRKMAAGKPEPLFPGYLFVWLDPRTPEWVVSRSAPGVAYFLGSEGVPTPLPDGLVEEIRRRVDQNEYRRQPRFRSGDRVKIIGGPFDGLEAVFDGTLSPTGRSRVLVSIVSRLVPVQLDAEQLQRLTSERSNVER